MNDQISIPEIRAKGRILVADDDRDFADTLARLLTLEGYEVNRAYNTSGAQAKLDRFAAEVALIDIRMGEGSGLSLVSELRQGWPEITCILMTAYSSVETAIEALQKGAYDYLCKPFHSEILLATLDRCFERIALAKAQEQADSELRQHNRELDNLNKRLERAESILRQRNSELEELNVRLQKSVHSMRELATFSSLDELCAAILEEVAGSMGAQGGAVYLMEAGQLISKYRLGTTNLQAELSPLEADAMYRDVDNNALPPAAPRQKIHSAEKAPLAFPLIGEEQELIGLVAVQTDRDRAFTRQDRELGEILVSFAGEAIRLVQALESLAWSEERLRSVIDNSPSSISLKDLEGRFVIVNKCFEEWYGHMQRDVAGKTSEDIFPKDIAQIYTAQFETVLNSQVVVEEEINLTFAEGESRSVLVTGFPVLGATGSPMGVGTIATDVTATKHAEEQLRQAQKTEALGHLTGGIAHDFNNLLAVILGNLDLMKDELEDNPDIAELLEDAFASAQSGAELTDRLLAFGRRQTLHPQLTDAGDLVVRMSRMLARTLDETIETRQVLSENLWPVEIDRNQLGTSLLNLALNARDAMPDGGVLTIETANIALDSHYALTHDEVVPGDYVVISVSDDGVGMPPEVVENAIQPFFTTKEVGHGSGLGLSMVYGFVKQSHGHLAISSTAGKGTIVRLYLPKAEKEACEGEIRLVGPVETDALGERILVVEDKADVRRLAKRMLTRLGYDVLEAADGKTALKKLDANPNVDLLFTDIVLPGRISGADLAKAALTQYPELKVLYTTGYANNSAFGDDSAQSAIRVIKKPYAKENLARMVRQALAGPPRETSLKGQRSARP